MPQANYLLDMGCGTGRHLEYLQHKYDVEGVDIHPDLIAAAGKRCPNLQFHLADIVTYRHPRPVDVVISLFSSIACVAQDKKTLQQVVKSMADQLSNGGIMLVGPWFTPDTYRTGTSTANFIDDDDMMISWMYTSERVAGRSHMDIHYMVGTPELIRIFHQLYKVVLFTHDDYLESIDKAASRLNSNKGLARECISE